MFLNYLHLGYIERERSLFLSPYLMNSNICPHSLLWLNSVSSLWESGCHMMWDVFVLFFLSNFSTSFHMLTWTYRSRFQLSLTIRFLTNKTHYFFPFFSLKPGYALTLLIYFKSMNSSFSSFWHVSLPLLLNSHLNRREALNSLHTIIFHTVKCEFIHKWSCLKFNKPLFVLVLFSPPVCFFKPATRIPYWVLLSFVFFSHISFKNFLKQYYSVTTTALSKLIYGK